MKLQIESISNSEPLLNDAIQPTVLLDLQTQLSLLLHRPSIGTISQLSNLPSAVPEFTTATKIKKPFIIPGIYDSNHMYTTDPLEIQTNVFNHLSNHFTDHTLKTPPPPPSFIVPYDFQNYNPRYKKLHIMM